jgi:hypothetical protein
MLVAPDRRRQAASTLFLILPVMFWLGTAMWLSHLPLRSLSWEAVFYFARITPRYPPLYIAIVVGVVLALVLTVMLFQRRRTPGFEGATYERFLRGTRVTTARRLRKLCRTRLGPRQVAMATIPMPHKLETLHTLAGGATGTGKSVLLRALVASILRRKKDRMVIVDPNGELLAQFYQPGDVILNPYDDRTEGWSFFNEVRADYDWKRFARSVVPLSADPNAEEWNEFGRLLLAETAKKLHSLGLGTIEELFRWCTLVPPKDLHLFLRGTLAESLFAGSSEASKALSSARFVLSNKLAEHMRMPAGRFSIRDWMADGKRGNLFITWREDMAPAMKSLVSTWVDVFLSSILSMKPSRKRAWWLLADELASMEKLPSLEAGLTKGRKHGLRIVACLQSTSQLAMIYGELAAQTIRACFRNLVVLGGSKTDPKTAEDMSRSLGDHEVERREFTDSRSGGNTRNTSDRLARVSERVVTPAEIQQLPDLVGYVAFAGDLPIAKVILPIEDYPDRYPSFVESDRLNIFPVTQGNIVA